MIRKLISFFVVCVMLCSIFTGCAKKSTNEESFAAWVDNSVPIAALKEYVEDVTNEKSENFIPVEDRIAVFDLDGTLYCETSYPACLPFRSAGWGTDGHTGR